MIYDNIKVKFLTWLIYICFRTNYEVLYHAKATFSLPSNVFVPVLTQIPTVSHFVSMV